MSDLKFDETGKYYKCFPQEQANSCGVACIRMINYYLTGKDIGAAVVRHYIDAVENNRQGQAIGRNGIVPDQGTHDFNTNGISLNTAKEALNLLRPAHTWEIENRSSTAIAKAENASVNNPMMVALRVNRQVLHLAVAVDKYVDNTNQAYVVVADPEGRIRCFDTLLGVYDMGPLRSGGVEAIIHMRNADKKK